MHGSGDVGFFRLVAPLYDVVMPPANVADLAAGLDHADRQVRRVLDLGGGTGRASLALCEGGGCQVDGIEPLVVDVTHAMLVRARDRGFGGILGDAGRLPLRDDCVDAVVVVDALHHFPDRDAAIDEAARVLRPGGVLVVREFDPGHPLGWLLAGSERLLGMNSEFLRPDELAASIDDAGLTSEIVDRGFGYTVVGVEPAS